jgi:hypothetical protein
MIMTRDLIKKNIALLEKSIEWAEEAICLMENKTSVTTDNDDRRIELAQQHIAECKQQIKELNAF